MTSEGQNAGQPAEATSGGPTSGGFPHDSDGQRIAGRASAAQSPAEGFPNSYGPPPVSTPGGGSPFVVPAVSTFGAGAGQGGTSYGSARVPQPDGDEQPQRGSASPYGSVSPESPYGPASGTYGARPDGSPWAPSGAEPAAPGSAASFGSAPGSPDSFGSAPGSAASFGSAAAFPPAGRAAQASASVPPPAAPAADNPAGGAPLKLSASGLPTRTPGATAPEDGGLGHTPFSAFGDQPIRVPGASLGDLPDGSRSGQAGSVAGQAGSGSALGSAGSAPGSASSAPGPAGFTAGPAQNSWMQSARPAETSTDPASARPASDSFPSRRGNSGGFPLRAPAGPQVETDNGSTPGLDLPIRSQQPFGGAQSEAPAGDPAGGSGFPQRIPGAGLSSGGTVPAAGMHSAPSATDPLNSLAGPDQRGSFPGSGPELRAPFPEPEGPNSLPPFPGPGLHGSQGADPRGSFPGTESRAAFPGADASFPAADSRAALPGADAPFPGADSRVAFPGADASFPADDRNGSVAGADAEANASLSQGDSQNASSAVPQPRDPGLKPVVGSARPVTASASVPGVRVTPPEAGELPPPSPAPQARVYGRPAPVAEPETGSDEAQSGGYSATPFSPAAASPYGGDGPEGSFGGFTPGQQPESPFGVANDFGLPQQDESPSSGFPLTRPQTENGYGLPTQDESPSGGYGLPPQSESGYGRPQPGDGPSGGYGLAQPGDGSSGGYGLAQPGDGSSGGYGLAQPGDGSSDGFGRPQPGDGPSGVYGLAQQGESSSDGFGQPQPSDSISGGYAPQNDGGFGLPQPSDGASGGYAPQNDGGFGLPQRGADDRGPSGRASIPPPSRPDGEAPSDGFPPSSRDGIGGPAGDGFGGFPPAPGDGPGAPGVAPQSPARATARATASARVSPPEAMGSASPYSMPGSPQFPGQGGSGMPGSPQFPGPGGPAMPGSSQGPGQNDSAMPGSPFPGAGDSTMPGSPFPGAGDSTMPGSPFSGAGTPGTPQFPGQGGSPYPGAGEPTMPGSPQFPGANGPGMPGSSAFGAPYSDLTTDIAGRGNAPSGLPDQYNEHTTDVSGRGNSPYVPAPALPPLPGEQPGGGAYPNSPAARATVTPPGPEDTTSWPGPAEEQGRFDQFKATEAAPPPAKPNVKTVPVALAVVLGAAILLASVFGLVYLISGMGDEEFKVAQGECVKREGSSPVVAPCSEAGTFEVVSIVNAKGQCADATQPYIVVPKDNGDQVLCLKAN